MNKQERKQMIMKNMSDKMKWLKTNHNYNIVGMFLQGSQNYEMDVYTDEYMSDVDVKALVLPSFEDVLKGKKMVSKVYVLEDNSHIEVKDIRLMPELWAKANPSYIELLFTGFYIIENNAFKQIKDMANEIATMNRDRLLSCCKGMAYEKRKALCHPYPNIKEKIDEYGYDPKQLHHLMRMRLMINWLFDKNSTFDKALVFDETARKLLMGLKTFILPLESAIRMADQLIYEIDNSVNCIRKSSEFEFNNEVYARIQSIIYGMVENSMRREVLLGFERQYHFVGVKHIKSTYESMNKHHKEVIKESYPIHEGQMVEYDVIEKISLFNYWDK